MTQNETKITVGIDQLIADENFIKRIQDRRIGLLAHPASTVSGFVHTLDAFVREGVKIEVLFGPEHGFGGEAQDMEPVRGGSVGPHGLPLYSLYGKDEESLSPPEEALAGLDILIVDLFDIGTRYYTFVWTALLCLRACYRAGVELILTDRPNPLGGREVEGEPQHQDFLSFVGLSPVSNRHGLTLGEIVSLVAKTEGIEENLRIVKMEGWQRSMHFHQTGLPWIMPSPNMPTFDTALVYPGLCLLESTWASEGRGTTRPFELIGAPGIDSRSLSSRLEKMKLPGVCFRPASFKPSFQKHAGKICGGVQLHVVDKNRFLPYRTGVAVLLALKAEAGDRFKWREQPYEFVTDRPAIDLLTGSTEVRRAVEEGAALGDIAATWARGEDEFRSYRRDFFLY
ncbi:MAG: DUF1343 domain-containing protein [Proteobacteria bacterium]|nr:DUF1343 domain-containing protein [Pseudomonadota bacterium]